MHNIRFPDDINWGTQGGAGYNTAIIETDSGAEQRIGRWSQARRRYNAAYNARSYTQLATLLDFFHARRGAENSFRFKDWSDFSTGANHTGTPTNLDQYLGTGDGTTTQFQLRRTYVSGAQSATRTIRLPVVGTTVIASNGVNVASGWSVSDTTGLVTFSVAPAAGVNLTWGGEYDTHVRFDDDADKQLAIVMDNYGSGSASVGLIEVLDEAILDEDRYPGGATDRVITANVSLSLADGMVQTFTASVGSLAVLLPDPSNIPPGGPIVTVWNGGANTWALRTHTNALLVNIASGLSAEVFLSVDSGGNPVWYTR